MTEQFEPRIIVFACNWCSYAGADMAGVTRLQYPPNVRIIRVMCTGRMELEFILNAFKQGADGVLICGCHPGDCHYLTGNENARNLIDNVAHPIVSCLGIGQDRLALEWVSASEGPRFAALMTEFTERIRALGESPLKPASLPDGGDLSEPEEPLDLGAVLKKSGAYSCYQCSQCTGVCPISWERPDYNPRKTLRRATFRQEDRVARDLELWSCLTCGHCAARCPHQVNYHEFVKEVRRKSTALGTCGECAHGGGIQKIHEVQIMSPAQERLQWVPEGAEFTRDKGDCLFFVGCAPYFEPLFQQDGSRLLDIARDGLKILNRLGITPVISPDEKCCGHDLLWSGRKREFEQLARYNMELVKATGASRVVFICAECFYTFNETYRTMFNGLPFEAVHLTALVAEEFKTGGAQPVEVKKTVPKAGTQTVTFQDPCRLGRLSGVLQEPREIINTIPGLDLKEMPHNRMDAVCCGSSGWTNCFQANKKIQVARLNEAAGTGADTLVTACPKCQIHLNCAKSAPDSEVDLTIQDITSLIAEALR